MLNNIKRNLTIFNKDIVETSWLKSLLDDTPKHKHIQTLYKCLAGEQPNIDPRNALKKISARLMHSQKPLTALKSLYLVHLLEKFLAGFLTEKVIDTTSRDPADMLMESVAHLYYAYLTCSKGVYEKINSIFRMLRHLEVLLLKINAPIVRCIATQLLEDMIKFYHSMDKLEDYSKYIKGAKQVKRFIEIRAFLHLSKEMLNKINSLQFLELQSSRQIEVQPKQNLTINVNDDEKLQVESCYQTRKMSLQTSQANTDRSKLVSQNTNRATSIRNNFYIPNQGPLSFLIPS